MTNQYRTFQLMVQILQQNSDDLNDGEDERPEGQRPCVVPGESTTCMRPGRHRNMASDVWPQRGRHTVEIDPRKKRRGRWGYRRVWRRPSSRRQRPQLRSSVPEPWRSWRTRRRGRRCRTVERSGICGKRFLRRRMQTGTLSQGTASSFHWWNSSEKQPKIWFRRIELLWPLVKKCSEFRATYGWFTGFCRIRTRRLIDHFVDGLIGSGQETDQSRSTLN